MSRENNSIVGNNIGASYSVGNKDAASHEEEVVEAKGRSNSHDVERAEAEPHMTSGDERELSTKSTVSKSIQERIDALNKQKGFSEGVQASAKASYLHQKAQGVSETESSTQVAAERVVNPQLVEQFGNVLKQLAKEKNISENAVVMDVAVAAEDGQPALSQPDLDGVENIYATIDESVAGTASVNEQTTQEIKHYSRLWVLFQKVKRTLRSLVINRFDGVKAKDFRAVPASVLNVLEGTELKSLADEYNRLRNQLVAIDKTGETSKADRDALKQQLLGLVMQMERKIDDLITDSADYLHQSSLKVSDKAMLAAKLRSSIGFDLATLKPTKEAASNWYVEGALMTDTDTSLPELPQPEVAVETAYDVPPAPRPISDADKTPIYTDISARGRHNAMSHYDVPPSNRPVSEQGYGAMPLPPPPKPPRLNDSEGDWDPDDLPPPPAFVAEGDIPPPPPAMSDEELQVFADNQKIDTFPEPPWPPAPPAVDEADFEAGQQEDLPPPPPSVEQSAVSETPREERSGYPPIAPKPPRKDS